MDGTPIVEAEIDALIVQECKLKGYSGKTIENYLHHIKKFIASKKLPRDYLLLIARGLSLPAVAGVDECPPDAWFSASGFL